MKGIFREHVVKRFKRSSKWSKIRKYVIEIDGYKCRCCGRKWGLQVHHIIPFSIDPSQELNIYNLITLCGKCHFLIGHLGSWKSWNKDVRKMANELYNKIKNRP